MSVIHGTLGIYTMTHGVYSVQCTLYKYNSVVHRMEAWKAYRHSDCNALLN